MTRDIAEQNNWNMPEIILIQGKITFISDIIATPTAFLNQDQFAALYTKHGSVTSIVSQKLQGVTSN